MLTMIPEHSGEMINTVLGEGNNKGKNRGIEG